MACRNTTKIPKHCLVYFSIDQTTSIVETKRLSRKENGEPFVEVGPQGRSLVTIKYNGKTLDALVIASHGKWVWYCFMWFIIGWPAHLKKVINYLPENIELVFVSLETFSVVKVSTSFPSTSKDSSAKRIHSSFGWLKTLPLLPEAKNLPTSILNFGERKDQQDLNFFF